MPEQPNRDEWICAYLDGALDEAGMAEFEAAMDCDPALAAEVERLLGNDSFLRAAFDDPIQQGVDDALLERLGLADPVTTSADVIVLAERRTATVAANDDQPGWRRWRLPAAGAVAAAVALLVTLGLPGGRPGDRTRGPRCRTGRGTGPARHGPLYRGTGRDPPAQPG